MTEQLTRGGVAAVKAGNSTDPVVLQVAVISDTINIKSYTRHRTTHKSNA
jgi:hypothetical protein